MANLKRNIIELVKEVKEGEIITEKYLTPVFIPTSDYYQAIDLNIESQNDEEVKEKELVEKLIDFIANDLYKGQFTKENLENGIHGPELIETLSAQLYFAARGFQTEETKKFLAEKNR
jgi:hypothetical protein